CARSYRKAWFAYW
nr:immunoglobulin heavy chain junction region [Mus musculus]